MTFTIKFSSPLKGLIPEPKPALQYIPEEYKNHKNIDNYTTTVKKCIPFLDAMLTGYIIPTPVDYRFWYNAEKHEVIFDINPNLPEEFSKKVGISGHTQNQFNVNLMSNERTLDSVFKFMNTWHIQTPKNYSCIFTHPFNRSLPYKILDGVIDTDSYFTSVNFPFYWTGPIDKEIIIEAGSPMCLVIPFKRDSWKMKVTKNEEKKEDRINFFRKVVDNYKTHTWSKKSYK